MPEEPRGTPRNPEEPRGTSRNLEEPRGRARNFEEVWATFQPALFKNKLEPLKAKPNWGKTMDFSLGRPGAQTENHF